MTKLLIVCAGRHGATALPILEQSHQVMGFLDDRPSAQLEGLPHLGPLDDLARWQAQVEGAWIGLGNLELLEVRRQLFLQAQSLGYSMVSAVHPQAYCCPTAQAGPGLFMAPFSLIHAHAQVGANVVLYSGSHIEHDCQVGDHVFLGPGVQLGGSAHIESEAYLSLGAKVGSGVRIGRASLVAAGAVVIQDVPPGVVVMGVPARIWGSLRDWQERKRCHNPPSA